MFSRCAESVRYKEVVEEEMRRKDNERRAGKVGGVKEWGFYPYWSVDT